MHSLRYLFLFINIARVFSQSCDYVQNIPVKYARYTTSHDRRIVLSECISASSIKADHVTSIIIECGASKLPEIGPRFINNMPNLEKIRIKGCNTTKISRGMFADLPMLTRVVMEDNQLTHIPAYLFDNLPSLRLISFKRNNISCVEDDAFANLPNLQDIDLSKNNLNYMSRSWFTNTTSIKRFFIFENFIEEIPEGMFKGWKNINWFDLSSNSISVIHKEAFDDVASTVDYLNLDLNYLKRIHLDDFPKVFIRELSLSVNLLNYLSESFIYGIRVRHLNLCGNPFKCSCLDKVSNALSQLHVSITCKSFYHKECNMNTVPVCVSATGAQDKCEESVEEEVTNKLINYIKTLGYHDLRDWADQCIRRTV